MLLAIIVVALVAMMVPETSAHRESRLEEVSVLKSGCLFTILMENLIKTWMEKLELRAFEFRQQDLPDLHYNHGREVWTMGKKAPTRL